MKSLILPLLLSAGASQAAVIYSGIQNIGIPNSFTSVYVDVDAITSGGTQDPGWDVDAFFGGEAFGNSANFQPVRRTVAVDSAIVNLTLGDLVNAADIYANADAGSSDHIGPAADQFQNGVNGYLGFRLITNSAAGPFYGWMRVNFSNTGSPGTIIDWAYENSGSGISVGAVPEPGALALLSLASGAFLLRRKR